MLLTDSYKRSEEYIYKIKGNALNLIYVPSVQSEDSLILISPDVGIPWGNSWKDSGTFVKIK